MKPITITQSITDRKDPCLVAFFKDLSKLPTLTSEEEIALAERIKEGDENAVRKLVEGNLRFVVSVAKRYQNRGTPLVDIIQSGVIGATKAAKLWDPTRGFKFISYAVWWIRQSIMFDLSSESRTVRTPMNHLACLSKINKVTEKFEQENNRVPSIEEIESKCDLTYDKINSTLTNNVRVSSLDIPFNDDDEGCLLDIIEDTNSEHSDIEANYNSVSNKIIKMLDKLTNREHDIVMMSFGLQMNPMTLEEISGRFGIGPERIRQILNTALDKLRKKCGRTLMEMYGNL